MPKRPTVEIIEAAEIKTGIKTGIKPDD